MAQQCLLKGVKGRPAVERAALAVVSKAVVAAAYRQRFLEALDGAGLAAPGDQARSTARSAPVGHRRLEAQAKLAAAAERPGWVTVYPGG